MGVLLGAFHVIRDSFSISSFDLTTCFSSLLLVLLDIIVHDQPHPHRQCAIEHALLLLPTGIRHCGSMQAPRVYHLARREAAPLDCDMILPQSGIAKAALSHL